MENTRFNNNNNNDEEEAFEFKNLLSEMFTSFPNENPRITTSSLEIPKIVFSPSSNTGTNSSSSSSTSQNIISFGNNNPGDQDINEDYDKVMMMSSNSTVGKRISRNPVQSQDHLLAERKRRERFSQLFALLAKTIPGLKKLDKASILEDAIKYIGELQERVSVLEDVGTKSINLFGSSSATAQKQQNSLNDNSFDLTRMMDVDHQDNIKVQILDKNVLIGIHCNKEKRSIFSIIAGIMENLHLTVHHIRVTPSNHHTVADLHYISILAEVDENVDIKVQDVEKAFELALLSTPNMTD